MSLSSLFVVGNALRLNFVNVSSLKKVKKRKNKNIIKIKDSKVMEKILKIEGMMCVHCEMRVKKILESFSQVESAVVSHEKGEAVITLNKEIKEEKLINAIESEGYKVIR